jgi:SAM-dependent methyltransferase
MDESDGSSNTNEDNNSKLKDDDGKTEEESRHQQEQHWAYKLFIEHPELFLPYLEQGKEKAVREVEGLCKIFDEYKMPKDSKILDLSCGIGRHSIPLAKKGYKVVGYDISSLYLQKAREWAKIEGLINNNDREGDESKRNDDTIKFYQGDLRNAAKILSSNGQTDFDAIISMETSFGYFGEEYDYQLFKDLASISSYSYSANSSLSSPIFVVDTINRDYLIREFQPFRIDDISDPDIELHIKRELNLESSSMEEEWKFYDKRSNRAEKRKEKASASDDAMHLRQILDFHLTLRVYSLHELIRLLKQTGWNCISKYGDIATLEPLNRGSRNMVLVNKKI